MNIPVIVSVVIKEGHLIVWSSEVLFLAKFNGKVKPLSQGERGAGSETTLPLFLLHSFHPFSPQSNQEHHQKIGNIGNRKQGEN